MLTWLYRLELAWNTGWSNISLWAWTYWVMIYNLTQGINTTGIYTRITALLGKARLVSRTILVDDTFRICTGSSSIDNAALTIHIAWWWVAWVSRWCWMKKSQGDKNWIPPHCLYLHGTCLKTLTVAIIMPSFYKILNCCENYGIFKENCWMWLWILL